VNPALNVHFVQFAERFKLPGAAFQPRADYIISSRLPDSDQWLVTES
jgi:hypothetical protein